MNKLFSPEKSNKTFLNVGKWKFSRFYCFNYRQNKRKRFVLSDKLHPQTISCVKTRAEPFEIKIEVENVFDTDFTKKDISGVIFQYPDTEGSIHNFTRVVQEAQANGTMTVAATDLMAMTILKPPGNEIQELNTNIILCIQNQMSSPSWNLNIFCQFESI